MKVIGMIADHPTPKAKANDDSAYTLNSRDYKGVMLVVISECDRQPDGKWIRQTWNTRSDERNVHRG